eukprot:1470367-Pyramimonas_sp.AAC.1
MESRSARGVCRNERAEAMRAVPTETCGAASHAGTKRVRDASNWARCRPAGARTWAVDGAPWGPKAVRRTRRGFSRGRRWRPVAQGKCGEGAELRM